MATDSSKFRTEANVFETDFAGITVRGKAHSLSAWFVVALRLMMGYAFLHAGWTKIAAAEPFDATGYLTHVTAASPLSDLFHAMGQTGWFVEFVNLAVPWGEFLVGMALLVGAATRLAAFFGAFMMLLFYFGNWEVQHGLVNGDFAYMLVFLAVAALGAGRLLGLDALIEKYDAGGEALVERYPRLRYVLG
ncbi:DoxX family protein [Halorussus ruber]|uniref:DoxX family protein n=1 Tax=Halorussus ruber TaxID=1126238 RepID=UPI001092CC8F|nr:DoxX family protein [Halorussus ruber]